MNCEKCDGYGEQSMSYAGHPVSLCSACARSFNEIVRPHDQEYRTKIFKILTEWLATRAPKPPPRGISLNENGK